MLTPLNGKAPWGPHLLPMAKDQKMKPVDEDESDDTSDSDSESDSDMSDIEIDQETAQAVMAVESELEANPNLYDKHLEVCIIALYNRSLVCIMCFASFLRQGCFVPMAWKATPTAAC